MALDSLKGLLRAATQSTVPDWEKAFSPRLETAWADAVAAEKRKPEGTRRSKAELLAELSSMRLSPAARRLLGQVAGGQNALTPPEVAQSRARGGQTTALKDERGIATGIDLLSTGVLRGGTFAGGDPLINAAAALSLHQLQHPGNPFASVNDAALLSRTLDAHARLYAEVLAGKRLAQTSSFAQRHARAALLATVRLVAERLAVLEGPRAVPELAERLVHLFKKEPHQPLRKFEVYRLLCSATFSKTPAVEAAEATVFPPNPPYEQWAKDGVLRVQCYCDDRAAPWEAVVNHFRGQRRGMGMKIVSGSLSEPTKPVVLAKDVESPDSAIERLEVVVAPRPSFDAPPSLFENMADDGTDIIIYTGHAGYGQRVDAALRNGVETTGAGKLVMLFQCWGEGNIDSMSRAFPEAQLFSTTEESDLQMKGYPIIERMLGSFLKTESWEEIQARVDIPARIPDVSGWDRHFFTPATRPIIEQQADFDRDGIAMKADSVYSEPRSSQFVRAPTGFNAVTQPTPAYVLDAAGAKAAVDEVSLILRYNVFDLEPQPPGMDAAFDLGPESVVLGGFFAVEEGAHEAFRFEVIEQNGRPRVRVFANPRFVHAQPEELKNFLAFELGKQLAAWSGRSSNEAISYGMAFYLQSLYHQQGGRQRPVVLENDAVEHQLFLQRYGLNELPLRELIHSVPGVHSMFAKQNLGPFLRSMAAWAEGSSGEPQPVGRSLPLSGSKETLFPHDGGRSIDRSKLEHFVHSLPGHEESTLESSPPLRVDEPFLVGVQTASNSRSHLVIELNARTGRPVAVHDLGDTVDMRHAVIESIAANRGSWAQDLWPDDPLQDAHATRLLQLLERELLSAMSLKEAASRAAELASALGAKESVYEVFLDSWPLMYDVYSTEEIDELMDCLLLQNRD